MDWRMTGRMSVGLVLVDSSQPGGHKFSRRERNRIRQEVIDGLNWLTAVHPSGNLSWIIDYQSVHIDVDNPSEADSEDYWLDPATTQINYRGATYPGSYDGRVQYLADMHAANGTDHEFLVLVTTYRCWHFGFARGWAVVMARQHNWGHYGLASLNRILSHETCHIFGAADEYLAEVAKCPNCDDLYGVDKIPNGNCARCARPSQKCLMDSNGYHMCNYTRGQIGWADDIFVELRTSDALNAGTDDHVELDIGRRTFNLDTPNHNDRERGNREGYALWTGGVPDSEMLRVLIRKSPDGVAGGWKLKWLKVWHKGVVFCDQAPNVWLSGDHRTWTGCVRSREAAPISNFVVRVTTADELWAGTDDDVTLKLAGRSWNLDNPNHNDFERGHTDTFHLDAGTGLFRSDIHTVTIKKSHDGAAGGWKLGGLKILADGVVIYDNQHINVWLHHGSLIWTAPI